MVRRHHRDEQPVDFARIDRVRLSRQQEPAIHIVEIQRHLRVVGLALGIVPQSDEPAFRRSPCIAAFDRKRRAVDRVERHHRSEEHTSELQSLMRISYAVFCLKKKINTKTKNTIKNDDNTTSTVKVRKDN